MKKPQMILFDYGHTLLYEPGFDFVRGQRAVFEYITENPHGVTPEQADAFSTQLFRQMGEVRKAGYELHEWQMLRAQYEQFGLKFSIPIEQVERVLWWNTSTGEKMPKVEKMLDFLKQNGIRTGVISNIGWSGAALKERIDRLLPQNEFEFVVASSEYGIRKPNPLLFRIALEKAHIDPSEVWYCGDSIFADVNGAHGAGIFPVLYTCRSVEPSVWVENQEENPQLGFEFLHIHDWDEIIDILRKI